MFIYNPTWPFPQYDLNGKIIIPIAQPKVAFDLSKCKDALL